MANQLLAPENGSHVAAAEGWNDLIDRICEREANMEVGVDGTTVRRILERLATFARGRPGGVGPIWQADLTNAFEQVTGHAADEGSYQLLQRLPGLGIQDASEGSRSFIDEALADVARAGDVTRYSLSPHHEKWLVETHLSLEPLNDLGVEVSVVQHGNFALTGASAFSAAERCQRDGGPDAIAYDLLRVATKLDPAVTGKSLSIAEVSMGTFVVGGDVDLSATSFQNCLIETLDLTEYSGEEDLPLFTNCMFGVVLGVGGTQSLNMARFVDCEFEQFDAQTQTTKGLLAISGLSPAQRVALTILKKLYAQRGTGRKETSLYRGMDDRFRQHVPEVLSRLESAGLAVRSKAGNTIIFLPARGQGVRVRSVLESGAAVTDEFLESLA